MSNIFLLSPTLSAKDRFTVSWAYCLDNFPEIGQAVVDMILGMGQQPSDKLVEVLVQPDIYSSISPDIVLVCQGCNIICEHKLESELEKPQVQSYIEAALQHPKPTYVALITNTQCPLSPDLVSSSEGVYLYPKGNAVPYFCWQDVYPLIARVQHRLAQEFLAYMNTLDMKPWNEPFWGDLFTNPITARSFRQHWIMVQETFEVMGINTKLSGYASLELVNPLPWIQLLYLYVTRSVPHDNLSVTKPFLAAALWVKGTETDKLRLFRGLHEVVTPSANGETDPGFTIEVRSSMSESFWAVKGASRPKLAASYYASLEDVVSIDETLMRQNLLHFARSVFDHAKRFGV
ncbi:MAG: hypothetical protein ACK456_02390 [Pseudanabaenaceae cyanobacterium]|jgi:hypothetical protein